MKPFAPACERNKQPILAVLESRLGVADTVLEIGAGTGQHAVYFASRLPGVTWIASDLPSQAPAIEMWLADAQLSNVEGPLVLDVEDESDWPVADVDAVFTANTLHIMPWQVGRRAIAGSAAVLRAGGFLIVYGPFNRDGAYIGEGNARFDAELRSRGGGQGIRDMEEVAEYAALHGLDHVAVHEMPANNLMLEFEKRR